ncbi:MAG: hypothetical protein Q8L95_11065 [Burkholderiales bacterium]|nr:hypothetical protein [Burkholderiales bacterium]
MTASSIISIIHELEDIVGKKWIQNAIANIEEEVRRPKKLPAVEIQHHPLGYLFHQVLPGLDPRSSDLGNTIRLAGIASDVVKTVRSGVEGVQDRVERLKSSDHTEVRSTFYEFGVSAMLVERNHEVRFFEEMSVAGRRTPDLLVDGAVEIECKQKGKTQQEMADWELWELFYRKVNRWLTARHRSYSVELFTDERPTRSDVDWAQQQARQIVQNAAGRPVEVSRPGVYLVVGPIAISNHEGGVVAAPSEPLYPRVFEKVEMMALARGNELDVSRAVSVIVRCGTRQRNARETSISDKLGSARGQFSGERPAVVYFDLQLPLQSPSELDMQPASEAIQDWLRQHKSIAAVVLTTDVFGNEDGHIISARRRLIHRSGNVRLNLGKSFAL